MAKSTKQPGVALVTGGSRGIGRGITIELGKLGWNVGINYTSNEEAAKETVELVNKAGGTGEAVQADISNLAQHKYLLDFMIRRFGRFDALINNAGVAPEKRADLLETGEASYDRVLGINLKGPFFLTQATA